MPSAEYKPAWLLLLTIVGVQLGFGCQWPVCPKALSQGTQFTWKTDTCQSHSLWCSVGKLQVLVSPKLLSSFSRRVWGCWTLRGPQASQLPVSPIFGWSDTVQPFPNMVVDANTSRLWLVNGKMSLLIDSFRVLNPQANTSAQTAVLRKTNLLQISKNEKGWAFYQSQFYGLWVCY